MKLLFLQEYSLRMKGGGASILKRLIGYASRYNIETVVAANRSAYSEPGDEEETSFSTLPRRARFGLGRLMGCLTILCLDIVSIISLRRLVKKLKPDVIHLTAHGVCFPVTALAARWSGKPTVLSVHDLWHWTVKHYIPESLAHYIFCRAVRHVQIVYVISENMGRYLDENYGIKNYHVVHDGIEEYARTVKDHAAKRSSFLYIGVLHDMQKQLFNTFIEALAGIPDMHFSVGICSNADYIPARKYENVHFENYGWLNEEQLRSVCANYSYSFLPLSFDEDDRLFYRTSLMTKISFYVKAGLPIFCVGPSDTSAVQIIEEEKIGWAITSNEVSAIKEGVIRVGGENDRYEALLVNLQRSATTTFSMDAIADRFYRPLMAFSK